MNGAASNLDVASAPYVSIHLMGADAYASAKKA
jgi:hypothetical protein